MELIDIDKISLPKEQYKKQDNALITRLATFININDQLKNIVINKNYELIEGFKILEACKQLNKKKIWCSIINDKIPEQIIAFQLNELRGENDFIKVSEILNKLNKKTNINDLKRLLPFDSEIIQPLITLLKFDWTKIRRKGKRDQHQLFDTKEYIKEKEVVKVEIKEKKIRVEEEQKREEEKNKLTVIIRKQYPCNDCIKNEDTRKKLDDKYETLFCTNCMEVLSYKRK